MSARRVLTLDFETVAIGPRTRRTFRANTMAANYPPEPVSFAIKRNGGTTKFYAWAHPIGNNATKYRAHTALCDAIEWCDTLVCHNAPFEIAVMLERLVIAVHDKTVIDTQVLAFLVDPYSRTLALKPLAERYLGDPPDEQDAVRMWLVEAGIVNKTLKKKWAAHISEAPGDIVAPYCIGDVERTYALYKLWKPMANTEAFRREMALQPVLAEMESGGVPLNQSALIRDTAMYEQMQRDNEKQVAKLLRCDSIELSKPAQIVDALLSRYPDIELAKTPTGKFSTARASLDAALPNGLLKARMMYDSSLSQTLKMFLRPWCAQNVRTPGTLHPGWNGTRNDIGGARTGRLSSSPNLQNLNSVANEEILRTKLLKNAPRHSFDLPALRNYVKAPSGHYLFGCDYSQIELRMTAHVEAGPIRDRYLANPSWDWHKWVIGVMHGLCGQWVDRRIAKAIGFGIIYGAGIKGVANTAHLGYDEARNLRNIYLEANPSLKDLMKRVKAIGAAGGYIETLGDRVYYPQPSTEIWDGDEVIGMRTYEYKLLNYLIQGGSADLMKEAMIQAHGRGLPLVMSIHDEPVGLNHNSYNKREAVCELSECMIDNELARRMTVPLLTDGYTATRWANKKTVATA